MAGALSTPWIPPPSPRAGASTVTSRLGTNLLTRFLPLARKLASRYANPHEPLEDLVQVASLGLLGAIDRFEPTRGVRFPAFAIPTILGELKRYFRNTGWSAHVPRGAQEMALRVDRAARQITVQTGRHPRVAELAEYLEVSAEDVLTGLDAGTAHYSVSLDAPVSSPDGEEPDTLGDSLGATTTATAWSRRRRRWAWPSPGCPTSSAAPCRCGSSGT